MLKSENDKISRTEAVKQAKKEGDEPGMFVAPATVKRVCRPIPCAGEHHSHLEGEWVFGLSASPSDIHVSWGT